MASLLLGCAAVFSSSLRRKQQLKKERQRERRENFEILKAENEKRVQRISGSIGGPSAHQTGLPKYDDIIAGEAQRQDAIRRSSTHLAGAATERRTSEVRDSAQPEAQDVERRITANFGNGTTSVENAAAP